MKNSSLVALLTTAFLTGPAFSMNEEPDSNGGGMRPKAVVKKLAKSSMTGETNQLPKSDSGVSAQARKEMYGGEVAHNLYLQMIEKGLAEILDQATEYRLAHMDNPQEAPLPKELIRASAALRYTIAKACGTECAQDFGQFRVQTEHTMATTGTHEPRYKAMKASLKQKIRGLIKGKFLQGDVTDWVIEGSTRYRLRQIPLKEWQGFFTTLPERSAEELFQFGELIQGDLRDEHDRLLRQAYAQHFFQSGCIATQNHEPLILVDYKSAIHQLAFDHYQKPELSFEKQTMGSAAWVSCTPSHFERGKKPKFYQVEIEHMVKKDAYLPGYGFMAMIPSGKEKKGDFPIQICHPATPYLPFLSLQYEEALRDALLADCSSVEGVKQAVGSFCFHWIKAMPLERGSAAVMDDILSKVLYSLHGLNAELENDGALMGMTTDQLGYALWSQNSFLANYKKFMKVNRL